MVVKPMPKIVFPDDVILGIIKKYENLPKDQRPFVYRLATSDRYKDDREIIERFATGLSGESLSKFVGNLQSKNNNCTHTYNELMVGEALRKMGYSIVYEPKIDGKTPDWLIIDPKTEKKAVVECFTCNINTNEEKTFKQLNDLARRLNKIRKSVFLGIYYSRSISLDQKRNEEISEDVSRWLIEGIKVGDRISYKGLDGTELTIVIEMTDTKLQHVHASPALEYAREIEIEPLRNKIQEKISGSGYAKLLLALKLPLIVAIVFDEETGHDASTLKDAVLGSDITRFYFTSDGQIVGAENVRGEDGVQAREGNESLSGVLLINNYGSCQAELYIQNPKAIYPFDIQCGD